MKRNLGIVLNVVVLMAIIAAVGYAATSHKTTSATSSGSSAPKLGKLIVLPQDGRAPYFDAIDRAHRDISIEICVLEDPQILQHLQNALKRGVTVHALVDRSKYDALASERANLAQYVTSSGGELHLSNPVFPRSFPKVILVDGQTLVYGSACLDSTTFAQYRDFAQVTNDATLIQSLSQLFSNDWSNSAPPGKPSPPFAPTPPMYSDALIVSPVNASVRLTELYQDAREWLKVYTELLGNEHLEGQLAAAARRGVHVLVITPSEVNGATPAQQLIQKASIAKLLAAGVEVRVSGPEESATKPYMHARAAIVDDGTAYLGSISLSPDSATENREVGLVISDQVTVAQLSQQFGSDWASLPSAGTRRAP